MGLSWQLGPLAPGAIGRFLVPGPLPERMLFAEPLRRRMRAKFGGAWITDSEDVVLLHEPGRYPVAYFPLEPDFPECCGPATTPPRTATWASAWYGGDTKPRAAWEQSGLPATPAAGGAVSRAGEDVRGTTDRRPRADAYHRICIRQTSRHLVVQHHDQVVADTTGRWCCMNPASRRAGTCRVTTLTR